MINAWFPFGTIQPHSFFYTKQFENLDQVAMHAELRDIDATLGISRWQPVELVMPWSSYMSCCLKEIAISQEKVPRS